MEMAVNIAGLGCWQVASELIGGAVDVGEPLVGQGLDSLASMELRQKLQVSGKGLARAWQQNLHGPMVSRAAMTLPLVALRGVNGMCAARRPLPRSGLRLHHCNRKLHFLELLSYSVQVSVADSAKQLGKRVVSGAD